MDGKSKISHNSPQPVGCVFTTATRARGARSILTHAATPQAERSEALVSRQAHALRSNYLHNISGLLFLCTDLVFVFDIKRVEIFHLL